MDFTMNMIDNGGRVIPVSQAAVAAMGGQVTYHAQAVGVGSQQQQQQQQQQPPPPPSASSSSQQRIHEDTRPLTGDSKVQELAKDDSQHAFTPPPRVSSVGALTPHSDARVEKGTDTNDFEPLIKVEIRGGILNTGSDKDKNSIVQLHFNSVNEVLHYFSQRSVPQHIDAFNLLSNAELVRNINPELVRNHFLYVPNPQDGVRVSTNGYSSAGSASSSQTPPAQSSSSLNPGVKQGSTPATIHPKQERRRGDSSSSGAVFTARQVDSGSSFICWICGIDLQKSLQYEEHMVDQHSLDKPYRCEDCGVTFKRKAHLDRHRRIHLPTRPYQCGVCGKGFTRNEHVRRHSLTHSGEKPYHCPSCNKTFSRREHLTKHLLSHTKPPGAQSPTSSHPHAGEYEYLYSPEPAPPSVGSSGGHHGGGSAPSTPAPASSIAASSLPAGVLHAAMPHLLAPSSKQQGHHRLSAPHHPPGSSSSHAAGAAGHHHGAGEPVPRPYQCGVCGKAFIRNEHLRRHVLTHSGEKPHACATCGKAFSRREHLTKHMRSHTKGTISAQTNTHSSHGSIQGTPGGGAGSSSGGGSSQAAAAAALSAAQSAANVATLQNAAVVATSAHQHSSVPGAPHSVASSHPTPVAHAPHLPPGTHYLPMFGLLAEVV
ncbi:uncharacterized protein LOC143031151 isoform X2 [Oratosquilla oratoria]|uniref:uncharacterized protein LOC143031151 isoform X2 n=1 Tax=Oratosquilla oratoria TaxID=337810 RepID=UPI003F76498C